MQPFQLSTEARKAIQASLDGGAAILEVYHNETTEVELKGDESPLTQADLRSNTAMMKWLKTSEHPVLSDQAIRKAIESFPDDLKICVFGTGGMSHQLQHERAGLINSAWDEKFMNLLVNDPDQGSMIEHIEYLREAGSEGIELVMWYVMRGALNPQVEEIHRFYHVPASNTAVGHLILENR